MQKGDNRAKQMEEQSKILSLLEQISKKSQDSLTETAERIVLMLWQILQESKRDVLILTIYTWVLFGTIAFMSMLIVVLNLVIGTHLYKLLT